MYVKFAYEDDVHNMIDWRAIAVAICIVFVAIIAGLLASFKFGSKAFHLMMNRLGNMAGGLLVVFSAIMSNTNGSSVWSQSAKFYFGVALPCILGLLLASAVSTYVNLREPERVTVSVECCVQNCGIAASVALTMFNGQERSEAATVPFYYGIVECIVVALYCLGMWQAGWTKAPKEVSLWTMLSTSYELDPTKKDPVTGEDFYYVDHNEAPASTQGTAV